MTELAASSRLFTPNGLSEEFPYWYWATGRGQVFMEQ